MALHKTFTIWDMGSSNSTRTEEIFCGLMLVSGITDKPNLKFYWAKDPVFETSVFSKTMALNHFESTLSFLHVSDSNMHDTTTDRLYKIWSILERLSDIFSIVYISKHWLARRKGVSLERMTKILSLQSIKNYQVWNNGAWMVCQSVSGYICKPMIHNASGMTLQDSFWTPEPLSLMGLHSIHGL
jgi:hypothetical protein